MKIYFFTGAGISQASGIPTYRDVNDGLWYNHKIEEVATAAALQKNPQKVFDFFNEMRKKMAEYGPNPAHMLISAAESDYDVIVVTQNVDDLHEQAGSSNVIHLHGSIGQMRSTPKRFAWQPKYYPYDRDIKVGDMAEDNTQLRPHVVLFGEPVPNMTKAMKHIDDSDMLIIVGTSLEVHPAASLVECFLHDRKPVYYIDPNPNEDYGHQVRYIREKAADGLFQLFQELNPNLLK